MKWVVVPCFRVDEDPPFFRITYDELEPLVLSAPGTPVDRPVEVRRPEDFTPLTFLMEELRLPLPWRFCCVRIMFEMESAVMEFPFVLFTSCEVNYLFEVRSEETYCLITVCCDSSLSCF